MDSWLTAPVRLAFFALFFTWAVGLYAADAPERVEPPFWWADMMHAELQIMAYGEDIGKTRVAIDYPGVSIQEVVAVESPNYLFSLSRRGEGRSGVFPVAVFPGG